MRVFTASLLALLLASTPLSAAKFYKWVDEDGTVTYSQTPQPGKQAESMEVRTGGTSDDAARSELERLTERAAEATKDRTFEATAAAEVKERDERIRQNCETARENRRILESAPRVQDTDASGNQHFLDDAARQEKLAATERQIEEFCE